jgi:hypothetical protein
VANKIDFFPMTPIEHDLVEFLLAFKLDSEAEFLRSLLDRQRGTISAKQRIKLWKIPTKYPFPVATPWPHKEVVVTISFLIEAMEGVYKEYWADRVADEHRKEIMRRLDRLTHRRVDWLESVIEELEDARPEEDARPKAEDIPF